MLGAEGFLLWGTNWFDAVVVLALLYGVWSGIRAGLSGEIVRVVGLVLMVALALAFYQSAGKWLQDKSGLVEELANLAAFVSIAAIVYLASLAVRWIVHRKMRKLAFAAAVENVGGAVAGLLRMTMLMAWLCVVLSLTRSEFWHHQVGHESRFGSFVIKQFPAVAAMAEKQFPETVWFLRDVKRRPEPPYEESGTQTGR